MFANGNLYLDKGSDDPSRHALSFLRYCGQSSLPINFNLKFLEFISKMRKKNDELQITFPLLEFGIFKINAKQNLFL